MQELSNTQYFCAQKEQEQGVKEVIATVYRALAEKGYNPVSQIVGYERARPSRPAFPRRST